MWAVVRVAIVRGDHCGSGGLIRRNETASLWSASPSQTSTQFSADQAGFKGSSPGTIATSVPEPSSPVSIEE
jgi:hypothetical protein